MYRHCLFVAWLIPVVAALGCEQQWQATSAEQIESDLELEAELADPSPIHPQQNVAVNAALVNTSKTRSYPVVQLGDGSMVGWREPHVFYSAEIREEDGSWASLPKRGIGRCGVYDEHWQDEILRLQPGERMELGQWLSGPTSFFELQRPGQVRMRLHYAYQGGETEETGGMGETPPFELVSDPIELTVIRPVEVKVVAKKPVFAGVEMAISDVIDVRLINRSQQPIEVGGERHYRLHLKFSVNGRVQGWPQFGAQNQSVAPSTLAPGESVSIVGDEGVKGPLKLAGAGKATVRAMYGYYPTNARRDLAQLYGEPVELEVLPRGQQPRDSSSSTE